MTGRSVWGWMPPEDRGIWSQGPSWARPLAVAAPWVTLAIAAVMFAFVDGRLVAAPGVVCDLPAASLREGTVPGLAALMMPVARDSAGGETLVFFDDARYVLSDATSSEAFARRLAARAAEDKTGELLLLADRRVPTGELVRLVNLARASGVKHVQIAERRE